MVRCKAPRAPERSVRGVYVSTGSAAATRQMAIHRQAHQLPSNKSTFSPGFNVTMPFFHDDRVPANRPSRLVLPRTLMMFTDSTLTFNASSTAFLTSALFARDDTRNTIWLCASRIMVLFSVTSGAIKMSFGSIYSKNTHLNYTHL